MFNAGTPIRRQFLYKLIYDYLTNCKTKNRRTNRRWTIKFIFC